MQQVAKMKETGKDIKNVLDFINELREDASVQKNIKTKLEQIEKILLNGEDTSIKVSKALADLEGIADDVNLQPYTRTQILNIVSLLEKI